jgi:hypothetical protein
MAFTKRLPQEFEVPDLRNIRLAPHETTLMHRYPERLFRPHIDSIDCWCSPEVWTYDQCRKWPLDVLQKRVDRFLCVH